MDTSTVGRTPCQPREQIINKFFCEKWAWVTKKPLFWANLVLVAATYLVLITFPGPITDAGPSDFRIRAWATFLQVLGAYTVWNDLTKSARSFGKRGIVGGTFDWIKAAFIKPIKVFYPNIADGIGVGIAPRFTRRKQAGKQPTIEERIKSLEYNLAEIDGELRKVDQRFQQFDVRIQRQVLAETLARKEADAELSKIVHDAAVGNFGTLVFGAWWVGIGIVLSGFAAEIARIIAGQWSSVMAYV